MENVLNIDSGAISIDFHQNNIVSTEVCYYYLCFTLKKKIETHVFVSVTVSNSGSKGGTIEPRSSWLFSPLPKGD